MRKYKTLSEVTDFGESFILERLGFKKSVYRERVDRNLGWLTEKEQEILQFSTVAIAGCGGMGGLLAATLLRTGIGHIKIADLETFDVSNLNRQFAANSKTVGLPKVIETARMLRDISEDTEIHVFPGGITQETIEEFSSSCNVICDELEFWAVGARLLLHQAIPKKTSILNANSVGMGTRLFRFEAGSQYKMKDLLRMNLSEAEDLENKIQNKSASTEEIRRVLTSVLKGLAPKLPEYMWDTELFSTVSSVKERLFNEGKAPILGTNPPMAAGFLANHVILELLRKQSSLSRRVSYPPDMPGYLFFDAALMEARVERGIWW